MAVIDSKKLLPAGKPGGAIVESQKPFLVPVGNISYKKDINISQKLLKPVDKEVQRSGGSLVIIKKKVLQIKDVIGNTYLIEQNENNRKRKEKERQKAEEREKRIETKPKSKIDLSNLPKLSIPGGSILDTINRFLAFTFAGYLFDKYNKFLPKLLEFGKFISPVVKFIDAFGKNLIDGVINFIDLGYRTYDNVRKTIEQIGGKDAAKTFDEFSGHLNTLLNGAIAAAMLIASTSPKGVSGAAGAGAAGAVKSRVTPKPISGYGAGTAMTPGRYRLQGQASAGGFGLELARKKATQTSLTQGVKGAATQGAKGAARLGITRAPIIGALIGFIIDTVVFREKPSRAAAGAVGNLVGSGIGAVLAGAGTFGLGAGVGLFVGGFLGDIVGKSLYDAFTGFKPEPTPAKAQGGQVGGGQSRVSSTRRIRTQRISQRKTYIPPKTQPGRDIGGKLKIEGLYGKDEPGQRSALRALTKSSADLKGMKSMQGIAGGMFGAGIDMALGQKPDKKLADSLGSMFGSVIGAAINAELDSSFGDISKAIAMANGGVVPSRNIGSGISIGEKIGRYISNAFSIALESSAAKVLRNLNQELNLEGGAPGSMPPGPGGGPLNPSQQQAFELIRDIAKRVGSPNPEVTAAIAMLESGWLANPNSVYFASGKTNPFGQTGRGPKGFVIGKDGQEHAVYNSLEEGVKAHVDRWKSSYIGKTDQEIIESIRSGRGMGAPGQYNTRPSWTQDVLGIVQSSKQPRVSSSGYKPPTPGFFNAIQYITGDSTQGGNYDAAGHGGVKYHEHFAFRTGADKERAKAALRAAGFVIGSEFRPGDPGYHGANLAFDVPFYGQTRRYSDDTKGEQKFSADVRRIMGIGASAQPQPVAKQKSQLRASIAPTPSSTSNLVASIQQNPSYSQGGNMIVHDVNNIVMPVMVS